MTRRKPEVDEFVEQLYEAIERGQVVPTGSKDLNISYALTRLRRNGLIKNVGSRHTPIWEIVEPTDRGLTLQECRKLRQAEARLEKAVRMAKDAQRDIDNILCNRVEG